MISRREYKNRIYHFVCFVVFSAGFYTSSYAQNGLWTWVHGDSAYYTQSRFGTRGFADSSNVPPGLYATVYWTDKSGKFWMYGGKDYNSGYYADLWKFDPDTRMWTWMKGDSGLINQPPTFGIKGVSSPSNSPGCRGLGSPAWTDTSGNLWLYGGYVKNRTGSFPFSASNDLWKYDTQLNEWTWMQGDSVRSPRVLGVRGVPSPSNTPGPQSECSDSWVDQNNNFWFYGGGEDFWPEKYLWRYNPNTNEWTWVSGNNIFNSAHYGTKGLFDTLNFPGPRFAHTSWSGSDGNFWLFGGSFDGLVYDQFLNDLWCYNPQLNAWAWFSGDDSISDDAHLGAECQPADTVTPANGIESRAAWTDHEGNLWKFGGKFEVPGNAYTRNQSLLWCFLMRDKRWMLVNSPVPDPRFSYDVQRRFGQLGIPDINSHPGARCGTASFKDLNGVFYLFGGLTKTPPSSLGGARDVTVNDMWSYQPDPACLLLAGVNEQRSGDQQVYLYPNPVSKNLTVKQSSGIYYDRIDLMTLHGQSLLSANCENETQLSVAGLSPGIYIIRLSSPESAKYLKVVIQ